MKGRLECSLVKVKTPKGFQKIFSDFFETIMAQRRTNPSITERIALQKISVMKTETEKGTLPLLFVAGGQTVYVVEWVRTLDEEAKEKWYQLYTLFFKILFSQGHCRKHAWCKEKCSQTNPERYWKCVNLFMRLNFLPCDGI